MWLYEKHLDISLFMKNPAISLQDLVKMENDESYITHILT